MRKGNVMWLADESDFSLDPEEERGERELFVENLGWLLSQTREGIERAYLDEYEYVHVVYKCGHVEIINVNADSYMAIVRDVVKEL